MHFLVHLKQQRTIVFSVFVALISLTLMILGSYFAAFLGAFVGYNYYTMLLLQELFAFVFVVLIAYQSKTLYTITRRGSGMLHAFLVGAYPLALICTLASSMFVVGVQSGEALQPALKIVIYFLSMFSIGLVEELVFRGIIGEALIEHYGTSYHGVWKATIIGGIIFGVAHMSNLFSADPFGVMIQVVVAAVIGMLFAAIYYRTGNLWVCILLHAGLDAGSMLESGLYGTGTIVEMVSSFSIANLIPCITYGLPILFILRRKKNAEVQFWFGAPKESAAPKIVE